MVAVAEIGGEEVVEAEAVPSPSASASAPEGVDVTDLTGEGVPSPKPVVLWDAKGPTWEHCDRPLEISAITLDHLHGKVLNEASAFISYAADDLERLRLDCHVSLLRDGGTMDRVEHQSLYSKPVVISQPHEQSQQFWAKEVFGPLKRAKITGGDIFVPIWNAAYEGWLLPFSEYSARVGFKPRIIEMRSLSAWLVNEFELGFPGREGEWTSLENLQWCLGRLRELFPARKRKKVVKSKS